MIVMFALVGLFGAGAFVLLCTAMGCFISLEDEKSFQFMMVGSWFGALAIICAIAGAVHA
jgi:hypothetical protein